jgi:hypothetical protein
MLDEGNTIENFAHIWFQSASAKSTQGKHILEIINQQLDNGEAIDEQRLFDDLMQLANSLEQPNGN